MSMAEPTAAVAGSSSPLCRAARGYRFIDYATQTYLLVVGLLILFFHNHRIPPAHWLLPMHGAAIGLIHSVIHLNRRHPQVRVLSFFRHFYPLLLYAFLYRESGSLNLMFVERYQDPVFIALEERIFGFQPAVAFMNALPYRLVSEFFYMAYFSYYLMISVVGLALFFRSRAFFWHYMAIVSFVFYGCFLAFIFLPVAGPPAFYMEIERFVDQSLLPYYPLAFPPEVAQGIFFRLMAALYRLFESGGGAFPSSHVAVAICTLYFSYRYLPRIRHLHLAAVVSLGAATIYCRYHYAVDVAAGALTAAVLIPLGELLYRRYR